MEGIKKQILIATVLFTFFSGFTKNNAKQEEGVLQPLVGFSNILNNSSQTFTITPKLLKLVKGESVIYLFGTIHVGKDSFYPLPIYITKSLGISKALAVEVDITNPNVLSQISAFTMVHSTFKDGNTLSDYLTKEEIDKIKQFVPVSVRANINMFRPWIIEALVSSMITQKAGFSEEKGVDLHLLNEAKSQGKKILSLEKPEEQLGAFISMSDKEMATNQKKFISGLDNSDKGVLELINFWGRGDDKIADTYIKKLENVMGKSFYNKFSQVMLYNRNQVMANRALKYNKSNSPLFIAVGAMHIYGEKTVQSFLEKLGYKVTKVN